MELLPKERTYELPGHLRDEPVVVNVAVVGKEFDVGELRKLAQASEGRPLAWRELSGRVTLLTPRQVELLASQVKVYETRVYAAEWVNGRPGWRERERVERLGEHCIEVSLRSDADGDVRIEPLARRVCHEMGDVGDQEWLDVATRRRR